MPDLARNHHTSTNLKRQAMCLCENPFPEMLYTVSICTCFFFFLFSMVWPETRFLGYIRSTLEVHFFDFILGVIKGKNFFL